MSGRPIKYRKYPKQGSGQVYIPLSVAQALKWEDSDELTLSYEVVDGHKGIFLYKK